ncbi:hypothetical protein [Micromonospora sp. NPDC049102]
MHGYRVAFAWGATLIMLAGLVTLVLVKVRKEDIPAGNVMHMD